MRQIITALVLAAVMLGCGETARYDQCVEAARAAADAKRRNGGITEEQIARQFDRDIQQCVTPAWSAEKNALSAAVNSDYREMAGQFLNKSLKPKAYVALLRDRTRKFYTAIANRDWLSSYARGDTDGDLVPDDKDRCPDTPALTPTDDDGCPQKAVQDLTPEQCVDLMEKWRNHGVEDIVIAPPYECFVYEAIDNTTVMYHPKCDGAPAPSIPVPLVAYPYKDGFYILSQVKNQPEGCPVLYEVEMSCAFNPLLDRDWHQKEAFAEKDDQDPSATAVKFQVGAGHPKPNVVHPIDVEFDRTYRWRARAVNGNGQMSEWSDWQGKSCGNHSDCKD
jgi:hypothetical protein